MHQSDVIICCDTFFKKYFVWTNNRRKSIKIAFAIKNLQIVNTHTENTLVLKGKINRELMKKSHLILKVFIKVKKILIKDIKEEEIIKIVFL